MYWPREGVHPKALPKILSYGVKRIAYVSCKGTSLQRHGNISALRLSSGKSLLRRSVLSDCLDRGSGSFCQGVRQHGEEKERERKKKFIINVAFYALIAILVWIGCKYLVSPMMPFIIAFLVAAVIQIPIRKFKVEKKQKKILSIAFCIIFYGLLFLLATWLGLKLLDGVEGLIRKVPYFYNSTVVPVIESISDYLEESLATVHPSVAKTIENSFEEMVNNLGSYVSSFSMKVLQILSGGISGIPGFVIKLVITVVATFFFVGDYDGITSFFKKLLVLNSLLW